VVLSKVISIKYLNLLYLHISSRLFDMLNISQVNDEQGHLDIV